ncbi:MAG: hypothetical protein R3B72_18680 [Polyangiaceae bacterium]
MFPVDRYFFDFVASTASAFVAVVMFLAATVEINRTRTARGMWADLGSWSLVLLAITWPANVVLALVLVVGVVVALILMAKQEAAEDERPAFAALIVLTLLGTAAMGLHYWYETGPTRRESGATITEPDEASSGGAVGAEPGIDDDF